MNNTKISNMSRTNDITIIWIQVTQLIYETLYILYTWSILDTVEIYRMGGCGKTLQTLYNNVKKVPTDLTKLDE